MILEGNARGYGAELARHLLNLRDNDHVQVHLLNGFLADNLAGALEEAEAISQATQCKKYLFSLSLNPPPDASVSVEAFEKAIAKAETALGLAGQPKAVVFHEKNGRRHAHAVYSRIDCEQMKAIQLPHFKRKLMAVSRELYLEHRWQIPRGYDDKQQRDPNRFTHTEAGQAKRAKRDTVALKKMFRACWYGADNQQSFLAALAEQGYALARGNRRGLVAVDVDGKVWSLSRWCDVKPRALSQKISDMERLPDVDQARSLAQGLPLQAAPASTAQDDAKTKELAALVAQQRIERAALLTQQKQDETTRLAQQPKGLRLAFMKITGRFDAHVEHCARETAAAKAATQLAQQHLINRHLIERRALMPVPVQTPTQQRLEIRDAPTGLTRERLIAKPTLILDELSKTRAAFTRTDTLRALSQWIDDPQSLSKVADGALKSRDAVRLSSDKQPVYTTRDYQKAETQLHQSATTLRASKMPRVTSLHLTSALAAKNREMRSAFGGALSAEQEAAIRHVTGSERLANVVGLAGAGKSTMLDTAADAWRKQGLTVHGAALAGKAADGLQDASGISSRTLASLELSWENGHAPIKSGDVLVIDEAGMIGTRQMARITSKIDDIGAKLVLVGDPEQLQPIEAGTPFREVTQAHGAAELTEVRRQTQAWQRAATQDLAQGETAKAVETYRQAGAVSEHRKQDEAIEALAEKFAMDAHSDNDAKSRIALAHKRRDVHALNQAIRAALRDEDKQADDILLQTETGERAFGTEDRIVFMRNDKELGVKNGMLGTVTKAIDGKVSVKLDGVDEAAITFKPRTYRHFDHGYAVTIHKSQGATVDQAYVLGSRSMDKHLAYVAMTRHRENVELFASGEDRPKWTHRQHVQPQQHRTRNGPTLG